MSIDYNAIAGFGITLTPDELVKYFGLDENSEDIVEDWEEKYSNFICRLDTYGNHFTDNVNYAITIENILENGVGGIIPKIEELKEILKNWEIPKEVEFIKQVRIW